MLLTKNFRDTEFFVHETPPAAIVRDKLPKVAALCQWLRDLAATPGFITSYYRSPARNAVVAESGDRSQHIVGEAADVTFPLISHRDLAARVLAAKAAGAMPPVGQVIFYPDTSHVHISLPGATFRDAVMIATPAAAPGPRQYSYLTTAGLSKLPAIPIGAVALLLAVGIGTVAAFFFPALQHLRG